MGKKWSILLTKLIVKWSKFYNLQESYTNSAKILQPHAFFYQAHPVVVGKKILYDKAPTLLVYKDNTHYTFKGILLILFF